MKNNFVAKYMNLFNKPKRYKNKKKDYKRLKKQKLKKEIYE